jgi:CheY-like chemotaxis protein
MGVGGAEMYISENIAIELIKIIPSTLWFLLFIIVLILFYQTIRNDLLPNLSAFKAAGVELSFVKESIDAALELAEKSPQWNVEVLPEDKEHALNRAKHNFRIFKGSRILWVDDHPENNLNERGMFRQLNTEIDIARSTEEALAITRRGKYDLVISDMARDSDATAGLDFLKRFRVEDKTTPVIFYVGVFDPTKGIPPLAFGITNRPDELLHLILDALERKNIK